MLAKNGYTKQKLSGFNVYAKGCKAKKVDYMNGVNLEASPANSKAWMASIQTYGRSLTVDFYCYGKANFKKVVAQMKAAGYEVESEGQGNQGQSWVAYADGKPDVSVWNDYGDTYIFSWQKH